tara:strand:+ start:860 stop:1087 length:228 start_codon:yes stop_codon:yes gene_type:complete
MKDRVSYDEQNYDLEQNYPSKLERDPDFAREEFRDNRQSEDRTRVAGVLKKIHDQPLQVTIEELSTLIDDARYGG